MTTIAFRRYPDKIVVGADTQLTWGNTKVKCDKLAELPDGSILGLAGSGVLGAKIEEWWKDDREGECPVKEGKEEAEDEDGSCQGILITNEGYTYLLIKGVHPIEIVDEFGAIGSGSDYARSAMYFGSSVQDAIKHAAEYDIYTNTDVRLKEIYLEKDNDE